jgi:hypothetical protein
MPENEFEKQVKELMEQFHISPSAPVWEKIKKRITEKKRRIWPVFFLLASVLIVSGYFFYTDVKHSNQNIKTVQQSSNNSTLKQNANDNIKKDENNNSEDQTAKSSIKKPNEINSLAIEQYKKNETVFTHQQSSLENNLHNLNNKTNKDNPFINKQTSEPNSNNISNDISAQPQNNSSTITTNTENNSQQTSDTAANKTSVINAQPAQQNIVNTNAQPGNDSSQVVANNIEEDKTDTATVINKEVAANHQMQSKKIPIKLNNNKWSFGITGMYGSSNITDKITSINVGSNKSLSQVDYLNTPGTPSNNSIHLKNPYSTNNAYNFGVIVQRKISKKSAISTGLNFVRLSSKNTTAISVDSVLIAVVSNYQSYSAGSNFYRVGTARTYTNNFSFIEIPVTFQSNIFKIKNFSLQYDAGFSVMRLLSSKSLIYNSKNNSFFFNDDLLRRTQFQINAGLNFQLHTNAGNFLLGPKLEYSLSTYLKTNDYDKLHFINYGIRASWLFNKK